MRSFMRRKATRIQHDAAAAGPMRQAFPRSSEIRHLQDLLSSPPLGPIVLTGPEGAGTSIIAAAAMAGARCPPPAPRNAGAVILLLQPPCHSGRW